MKHVRRFPLFVFLLTAILSFSAQAATKAELDKDAREALSRLTKSNPTAAALVKEAKAVLVFPNIVKAGFIFGGAYGEGTLIKDGEIAGYYNSVTASWGFQAGAQSYSYALLLMNDAALNYLHETKGWEIGVGPTVAIVDEGAAKNLSTSTAREDAYAFISDQQGLMASLSLEGTKISRIKTD